MSVAKNIFEHIKTFLKWTLISTVIGIVGGITGVAFHKSIDFVTEIRISNLWLIYLLPLGGVAIALMYNFFRSKGKLNTDCVIEAVRGKRDIPAVIVPLIFVASNITHLLGGSAGREGAALQIGGGIGFKFSKILKFDQSNMKTAVMAGMSSVFSALFGTPLTAALFSLEVTDVGQMHHSGLVPCIISSVVAYMISLKFGVSPVRFDNIVFDEISILYLIKIAILSVAFAIVSILFCVAIKKSELHLEKVLPNRYVRGFIGGGIVLLLTLILKTNDYNGAGMDVIERAISGEARYEAFILKIIFTAVTVAAGFKGGEIVPAFFVGATAGCAMGGLLGVTPSVAAALGFVALFCGVVNCPVTSILLSIEVFGVQGIIFFALACSICYMLSGKYSLYESQKIVYSKLKEDSVDELNK